MKLILKYIQIISLAVAISSCGKDASYTPPTASPTDTTGNNNDQPAADTSTYSFLALGDSYTIGQAVQANERFPAQTISLLKSGGFNFSEPEYIATSGWTTVNLQTTITAKNPQGPFDVVTLLIGVNDQYQTGGDTTGYRERFTQLLEKSIKLAGDRISHVFVLSIPDYSVTPFATGSNTALISTQIDQFNAINKEVTMSYKVDYTDITPFTRLALTDATLIAVDGLHPSGKEYAVWAGLLAPKIKDVIK